MHSSRMRTARLLTISQHAMLGGGGWGVPARGVYLPGGVPAQGRGVYLPRGGWCTCMGRGCTCPEEGGIPAWGGGIYLPGVYLPGVGVPDQVLTLSVNRMTDNCKNITLPQTSFSGGNKTVLHDYGDSSSLIIFIFAGQTK